MGRKRLNLIGDEYGKLTVIEELDRKGYTRMFLCECECGNKVEVQMSNLRTGHTKSCGCLQKEITSTKSSLDLKGKSFGRLTVVRRNGSASNRKSLWLCKCDCGKHTNVRSTCLTSGRTKSCGCRRTKLGKKVQQYAGDNLRIDDVYTPLLKSKIRSDNSTGVKGVYYEKRSGKYIANIGIKRRIIYLGRFDTLEEATRARKIAENKYHKPYLENSDKN